MEGVLPLCSVTCQVGTRLALPSWAHRPAGQTRGLIPHHSLPSGEFKPAQVGGERAGR